MSRSDPIGAPIPDETLEGYISLGRQIAARMAAANFSSITAAPSWTRADIKAETDRAIERMEITARDMLAGNGAHPNGANWREIWTAMEGGYREVMAALLRIAEGRGGRTLQ